MKRKALMMKPGLAAIEYGFDDCYSFEDSIAKADGYLDRYDERPLSTDILYLAKILRNKVFRGRHSC